MAAKIGITKARGNLLELEDIANDLKANLENDKDKIEIKEFNKKISKFFKLADTIPINLSESELERYNLVLLNVKKAIDYLLLKDKSYTKYRKKVDLLSAQIFKIPKHKEKEKELPRAEEKEEHPNVKEAINMYNLSSKPKEKLESTHIEEARTVEMLINAIDADYSNHMLEPLQKDSVENTKALILSLYNYYYAMQTNTTVPDNEWYRLIKQVASEGKDPFELLPKIHNIREKAKEIILNEVKIEASKDINELKKHISELEYIQGTKGIYSAEEVNKIIDKLNDYFRKASALDPTIESIIREHDDPFRLLVRTYGIRERARALIMQKSIVDETYAKLKEGDLLLSSGGGYSLYITYDDEFYKLKAEADAAVNGYIGKKRAEKLNEFVHDKMTPDLQWNSKSFVSISDAIKNLRGVCKEYAAILYMLLDSEGYDVYYVRGTLEEGGKFYRHAWLRLDIDGKSYLVDPANNRFGLYDKVLFNMHYKEGENKIERRALQ